MVSTDCGSILLMNDPITAPWKVEHDDDDDDDDDDDNDDDDDDDDRSQQSN